MGAQARYDGVWVSASGDLPQLGADARGTQVRPWHITCVTARHGFTTTPRSPTSSAIDVASAPTCDQSTTNETYIDDLADSRRSAKTSNRKHVVIAWRDLPVILFTKFSVASLHQRHSFLPIYSHHVEYNVECYSTVANANSSPPSKVIQTNKLNSVGNDGSSEKIGIIANR